MTFGHSVWEKVYARQAFVSPEWHSKSSVSVLSLSVADSTRVESIFSLSLSLSLSFSSILLSSRVSVSSSISFSPCPVYGSVVSTSSRLESLNRLSLSKGREISSPADLYSQQSYVK